MDEMMHSYQALSPGAKPIFWALVVILPIASYWLGGLFGAWAKERYDEWIRRKQA